MKKLFFSIGENMKVSDFSDLIMNIDRDLDSGAIDFNSSIWIYCNDINELCHGFFKKLFKYLSNDLGMIMSVYFCHDKVTANLLDVVKDCDRFFFPEGAVVTKAMTPHDLSSGSREIDEKIGDSKEVEKVSELRFIEYKKKIMSQRSLYFGLDNTALTEDGMIDSFSEDEFQVFGDTGAFQRMQRYKDEMSSRNTGSKRKVA